MIAMFNPRRGMLWARGLAVALALGTGLFIVLLPELSASPPCGGSKRLGHDDGLRVAGPATIEIGGSWYWMRSPDEEKRVIAGHFNRYCVRCHGLDGRGVWDIPDVPDFTNARWQASRSDSQLARIILEGRGAVMPPFRGTLTLEESWAMARYLRTFAPGTEIPRPVLNAPK